MPYDEWSAQINHNQDNTQGLEASHIPMSGTHSNIAVYQRKPKLMDDLRQALQGTSL